MAWATQLGYHVHIKRYVQLAEFGYCLHNMEKGDIDAPHQPTKSRDEAGSRLNTDDLMSPLWSIIDIQGPDTSRQTVAPRAIPHDRRETHANLSPATRGIASSKLVTRDASGT